MVRTTRHQLFRAQAVTFALARLLTDAKDIYEANLRVVFASLGAITQETILFSAYGARHFLAIA